MNVPAPSLVLLAAGLLLCGACGGKLEDPERFRDLLDRADGGGGNTSGGKDAAVAMPPGKDAGGQGGDGDEPPSCVTTIFKNKCGTAGCHDASSMYVDFVSSGVTERLLDQDSSASGLCKDRTYISTGSDPSLLLQKLSTPVPCGSPMPLVGMLSATEKQCITDWVTDLGGTAGGS
jgi:hypothetical protein